MTAPPEDALSILELVNHPVIKAAAAMQKCVSDAPSYETWLLFFVYNPSNARALVAAAIRETGADGMAEVLRKIIEYSGGADNALEDRYAIARAALSRVVELGV